MNQLWVYSRHATILRIYVQDNARRGVHHSHTHLSLERQTTQRPELSDAKQIYHSYCTYKINVYSINTLILLLLGLNCFFFSKR